MINGKGVADLKDNPLWRLLGKWFSIPRTVRRGFLAILILLFYIYAVIKGTQTVFGLFNGEEEIPWRTLKVRVQKGG